jgi:hypothetical protein
MNYSREFKTTKHTFGKQVWKLYLNRRINSHCENLVKLQRLSWQCLVHYKDIKTWETWRGLGWAGHSAALLIQQLAENQAMRNRPRALHGDGHLHKMHKRGENVPSARVCVRVCARVVCTYYSTYRAAEGAEWGCCCNRSGCRGIERLCREAMQESTLASTHSAGKHPIKVQLYDIMH